MTAGERNLFLAELEVSGNVLFACRVAGVTRTVAYEIRRSSPRFEKLWREAAAVAYERAQSRSDGLLFP